MVAVDRQVTGVRHFMVVCLSWAHSVCVEHHTEFDMAEVLIQVSTCSELEQRKTKTKVCSFMKAGLGRMCIVGCGWHDTAPFFLIEHCWVVRHTALHLTDD